MKLTLILIAFAILCFTKSFIIFHKSDTLKEDGTDNWNKNFSESKLNRKTGALPKRNISIMLRNIIKLDCAQQVSMAPFFTLIASPSTSPSFGSLSSDISTDDITDFTNTNSSTDSDSDNTAQPSISPTKLPTASPSSFQTSSVTSQTQGDSSIQFMAPSVVPTHLISSTSDHPSLRPSLRPSSHPSIKSSQIPSGSPSISSAPSIVQPSNYPSSSSQPTCIHCVSQKLMVTDGSTLDYFGWAVALHDNLVVVGVPGDNDFGVDRGSVYTFDTDRTSIKKFWALDGHEGDQFGYSVDVSSTYIVVGAPTAGNGEGSAYIFDMDRHFVAKLLPPSSDRSPNNHFGWSVAISDTDSGGLIVVGSPNRDTDNGIDSGSAYIFQTNGALVTRLLAPDGAANDKFGSSVAISNTNIVVGAPDKADNGLESGAAYIYRLSTSSVSKLIIPLNLYNGKRFGTSLSISGNMVAVGAPLKLNDGTKQGSVFIYNADSASFLFQLDPPQQNSISTRNIDNINDNFGSSVAISDTKIAVGAYTDGEKGNESGSVYLYNINGGFMTKLTSPDGNPGDFFGRSIAVTEEIIVVGAHGDDNSNGNESGSVYLVT